MSIQYFSTRFCCLLALFALSQEILAAQSIILTNPSFEEQTYFADEPVLEDFTHFIDIPGYINPDSNPGTSFNPSSITGWDYTGAGLYGINNDLTAYPFADNGKLPDNKSVAFMQAPGALTQNVSGLDTSKQYWLQFYVNSRSSATAEIGSAGIPNGRVLFNGDEFAPAVPIPAIEATGVRDSEWNFINFPFTPAVVSGDLTFEFTSVDPSPVGGGTDGTLLLDAVSLIQRDPGEIVIQNPSFEASGLGVPFPGYHDIAGWDGGGNVGTQPNSDGTSPFADNGLTPDGNNVAFIQIDNSLSQTIDGFTAGSEYEISFSYNARGGNAPHLNVTLGAETILDTDVSSVEAADNHTVDYLLHTSTFIAAGESELLTFAQTLPTDSGDNTVLLDNVSIRLVGGEFVPGDFNQDGFVDGLDLTQWQGDFGVDNGSDADGDGDSDGNDFLIWQRNMTGTPMVAAVPEPPAWVLLLGAWGLLAGLGSSKRG